MDEQYKKIFPLIKVGRFLCSGANRGLCGPKESAGSASGVLSCLGQFGCHSRVRRRILPAFFHFQRQRWCHRCRQRHISSIRLPRYGSIDHLGAGTMPSVPYSKGSRQGTSSVYVEIPYFPIEEKLLYTASAAIFSHAGRRFSFYHRHVAH